MNVPTHHCCVFVYWGVKRRTWELAFPSTNVCSNSPSVVFIAVPAFPREPETVTIGLTTFTPHEASTTLSLCYHFKDEKYPKEQKQEVKKW